MFVTFIIILIPFCQIIEIRLYYHVYRDIRAYMLDHCIQEFFLTVIVQFYSGHGLGKRPLGSRLKHTTPARVFPRVFAWTHAGVVCSL